MLKKRREVQIDDMPYPQKHDLAALVGELHSATLARLLAKKGIFLFPLKEDKSSLLWRYSFSYRWYLDAFRSPDPEKTGYTLIGYRARIPAMEELEKAINGRKNRKIKKIRHKPEIVLFEDWKFVVDYTIHRTSYAACFADEDHRFIVEILKEDGGIVEFRCNPSCSADSLVAREVIKEILNSLKIDPDNIELERLSPEERTDLFKQIFRTKTKMNWRMVDVCSVALRSSDMSKEKKVASSDVQRLSQAILHGAGLDSDNLVTSLTENGKFYFSAATFWCRQLGPGGRNIAGGDLKIKIAFKRNPKVLEVNVITMRVTGADGKPSVDVVPTEIANEICDDYWKLTHSIYENLLKRKTRSALKLSKGASTPAIETIATPPDPNETVLPTTPTSTLTNESAQTLSGTSAASATTIEPPLEPGKALFDISGASATTPEPAPEPEKAQSGTSTASAAAPESAPEPEKTQSGTSTASAATPESAPEPEKTQSGTSTASAAAPEPPPSLTVQPV